MLEEIGRTRNFCGRQKFIYASEPDDARTKAALRWTDVTEKGEYWVLSDNTAVKMTVAAIEKNPAWPVKYTIQQGDSLALIANRFYDDEARWKDIAKANNIKDAKKIKPGMVLTIPPVRDRRCATTSEPARAGDHGGSFFRVAGKGRCFTDLGKRIALFSLDNVNYAIDDTCTHGAGPLSQGNLHGEEIECPVYSGRFNIKTGAACHPPAEEPVAVYNVRVAGDDVEVEVEVR